MQLQIDSIQKSFGNKYILSDIYITMEKGEIVGLLGSNGSGKSTLFNIIMGLLAAHQQYIKVGDVVLHKSGERYKYIAYLPQKSFLPSHLTIQQILGVYLDEIGLKAILKHKIILENILSKTAQLSGGTIRFVELLLVLYTTQPFIILDEPFTGVSPIMVEEVQKIIKAQSQHKGIIISDHQYKDVLEIVNRTYLLFQGKLKEVKDKQFLMENHYISPAQFEDL